MKKTPLYTKESSCYKAITRNLLIFVGASNVSLSLVDNEELRELLQKMDCRYEVPHRRKLGQDIDKVYTQTFKPML